ncbi:MAG TPA: tetratricopeptide repeat protein, partial [Kofleriaceae bacterium]|nr:tetratricopeptide repeat protein [Kofleriaceae bacterium]
LPPDDLRIARSTSLLARNRRRAGAYGEADALYQQALSVYERRIGPDHPTTAQLLDHLGIVAVDLHHFDEATARSTRALAIKRRVFGAESSEYADTLSNLGNARFRRGDVDGAVAAWQGSLAIYEARSPGAHEDIARVLGNLGVARSRQGRFDDAAALHRRTLAIRSAHASPAIGQSHDNLGHVLFDRGDYAGAIAEYRLALDADRKNRPRDVFRDRTAIAQALVYSGRCAEARPDLRALIGDIDAQAGAYRTELIEALTSLGRCELEAGSAAVATALLERALATAQPFIDKGDMDPVEIAVAQLEAARALWASGGNHARADQLAAAAERALDTPSMRLDYGRAVAWRRSHRAKP